MQMVAAVLQTSDRNAQKLVGAALGKLSAVAAVSGISGLVGTFGTAGTGTAIATLSGAAANTAQLYWIGSWVGHRCGFR